jgi:hypothetical protein
MKKTILEIYALAVCFVTVTCFIICLGIFGYSLIQINKPEFTMHSYVYDQYQSNDAYRKECRSRYCSDEDKKEPRPSEEKITKQRLEAFSIALKSEEREGYQTLVKTLIIMLADASAFFIHWIISKKARNSNNTA